MMRWFGESWGAPVCRDCPQIDTPVRRICGHCNKSIVAGDQGVVLPFTGGPGDARTSIPYHLDCFLHTIGVGRPAR